MRKKIIGILIFTLLISPVVFATKQTVKTEAGLSGPPKKFDWTADSNNVSDLKGKTVTSGSHRGTVQGIEDSGGDKKFGYCDYIVIKWDTYNKRQPYWKYHCKKATQVDKNWTFNLDYNSKSKNPPKVQGCCHFVDDDNTAGPWIGTPENPFNSIKQALDSGLINDFDNIYVSPGTYNENNIVIDHPLNLIGGSIDFDLENPVVANPPVINGGAGLGATILLTIEVAEGVISGFNIINSGENEEDAGIQVNSDHVDIFENHFEYCTNGIYLCDCDSCNVYENDISDCEFALFLGSMSSRSFIFLDCCHGGGFDDMCAIDHGVDNYFSTTCDDDGYGYCGNYYYDYDGIDADGDGFGDTPYPIPGEANNFDYYPLMDMGSLLNDVPTISLFDGPTSGKPGTNYNYSVAFLDPEHDDGFLTIDWDDSSPVEIFGPFGADNNVTFEHTWAEEGTYNVKVRAIDMLGATGDWETLEVTMPKNKVINTPLFFQRFFQRFPLFEKILNQII